MASVKGKQNSTVFVGNIPYGTTEEQLREVFGQVGNVVSFRILYDKETGKPKGFGFCEYEDTETAMSAIRNLNQVEVNGRPLRVDYTEGEKRDQGGASGGGGGAGAGAAVAADAPKIVLGGHGTPAFANGIAMRDMSLSAIFDVLLQLRDMLHQNPDGLRTLLQGNQALSHAVVMGMMMLGLMNTPAPAPVPTQMPLPPGLIMPQMMPGQQQAPSRAPVPPGMMPPGMGMPMPPGHVGPPPNQAQLIQQVMSMTPQQIDRLPPAQRGPILQMRAQIMAQQQQQQQQQQHAGGFRRPPGPY
ncbi:Cleavage stimulating factor 64 [Porphyridium purpureum]|uniref:Cleavage stimulating factor 64 n=1 Tax=Porphyridium purpureum TaxID=35688 RepID=A0A5J4Z720_PORPP|nr:Cleavage stimulating factor 64 [Porphyridium purpureum]|eukprot:POR8604..scf295_1